MKLGHYAFGLACFVAAGLLAAHQGLETYRIGYRVDTLLQERARLEEARHRLGVALEALQRPDRLMEKATELQIPLAEPELTPSEEVLRPSPGGT